MSAAGAGILGGAIGGGLAVTILAPLTAANNFLGSYFFGSGMILGERQMYQDDWIKIKKRLDAGESFLVILEEVMKPNTQAVMQMARQTVIAVHEEWNDIVLTYLRSLSKELLDILGLGDFASGDKWPLGEGVIGKINGVVQCHSDYHRVGDTCVLNEDVVTPPPPPVHVHTPGKHGHKTIQQIKDEEKAIQEEIEKQHGITKMAEYTTFLNEIVSLNKRLKVLSERLADPVTNSQTKLSLSKKYNILIKEKKQKLLAFDNWKKNNRAWLVNNNLS